MDTRGKTIAAPDGAAKGERVILLVGNPNVGKSVLFNNLTGHYVTVSNYPGTTVDIVRARASFDGRNIDVVDTPGINDLAQRSDDARVTRRILDDYPEAVILQVADAKNLRRALLLTLQMMELGHPMVLALNMADELDQRGIEIDVRKLGALLGIPVVRTVAIRNEGTPELVAALDRAGRPAAQWALPAGGEDDHAKNQARLEQVKTILAATYRLTQPQHPTFATRLGFWAMHPFKGLAVLAVVLTAFFWFVGLFGAGTCVDAIETALFQQRVNPLMMRLADAALPFPHHHQVETVTYELSVPITPAHNLAIGSYAKDVRVSGYSLDEGPSLTTAQQACRFVHDFLVGDYGILTMALSYALAIVFPIVTVFFILFSLLEDSGYLPRMAIMVNRIFRLMGLNGKAVLPMILGLGCATMATMTTRILESRKERLVTTLLLALAVPCSAQLGVLLAMVTRISAGATVFWVALVIAIMFAVGSLAARLFTDEASDFILEIPPVRRPQISNVLAKTFGRLEWYMKEVIPLFMLGTAALFFLDKVHALGWIATLLQPVITGWLGLPKETAAAFLVGFLRRDYGAVYLLDAAMGPHPTLDAHQVLVSMVTITLFMPCIATFFMISREYGQKIAWIISGFVFPFSILVGGLVHRVGHLIGI